jgi:hypothetical protein
MTSIEEHERAVLTADVPEKGLVAGDVGTVVSVHYSQDGGHPAGYTLEFFSLSGETIALAVVDADCVRSTRATDVNHVRSA